MIDISIIMPVYNSEKYIKDTIDSILFQSYLNYELILVDDGSTDSSGEICDEYAESDSRVKVYHKTNEGICKTRNYGLDKAKGRYIAFCDNDDLFMEDLLKDNIALADKYDADVVRFSRQVTTMLDGKIISATSMHGFETGFIEKNQFAQRFNEINATGEGIWAGIYKNSFLKENNIVFNEKMRFGYEDLDFINKVYMCNPSVALNSKVYYNWIMRYEHSTSGKTDINNINSLSFCIKQKDKLIQKYNIESIFDTLWIEELSKRIYSVVRYVSPIKVKLPLKERISYIKHFRKNEVFDKTVNKDILKGLKRKSIAAYLTYVLFAKKKYYLLYFLIIAKQRICE